MSANEQYFVVAADGKEYGPADLETLRQWVREGRVVHGTHIKQAGGGVQYAGKMAELVDLFPPRDPHASAPGQAPPPQSLPSSVTLPSEFRVWEFIGRGWDVVKPHWLIFTGMFFILMAIEGVPYLGPLASFIIGGALMVGVWRAILGAIGGRMPDIGMMFQGFDRFGDAFLAQLIRGILIFLGFLCLIVPVIILGIMLHGFDRFGDASLAHLIMGILIFLGVLCLSVPGIILSIMWMFTYPIIAETNLGFWEAMRESARLTEEYRWRLFLLLLASIPVLCLGLLVFCLGVLVAIPVIYAALGLCYRFLQAKKGAPAPGPA